MDLQLDNLIFLILLLTTIVYWAGIIYTDFKLLSKISFYGTVAANGLIFILLSVRWLNYGYFPLSNLYESLLFLAWGITFTTFVLESRTRTSIIGSISNPISLFIIGFAGLSLPESMQAPAPLVPALKSKLGDIKYSSILMLQILTLAPFPRVASFKKSEETHVLVVSVAEGVPYGPEDSKNPAG